MRNRSSDESDDSENFDPIDENSCSRSDKVDSLNWNINREFFVAQVATTQKITSPDENDKKSDDVKSVKSKISKEPKSKTKLKEKASLLCGKQVKPKIPKDPKPKTKSKDKTRFCKGKRRDFRKSFLWCCCCWRKKSDKSTGTPASTSTKKKKRKKTKKKNKIVAEESESKGIQVQEDKRIEKKRDKTYEREKERVEKFEEDEEKILKNHDQREARIEKTKKNIQEKPVPSIQIDDKKRAHFEETKETVEEKPVSSIEISPLVTAGTSADRTKSCCYFCAQNTTVILEALETLITPKRIECRTDTKSTQVAVKQRVKTKSEAIETLERGTVCKRSDLQKERKKYRIKKCKISKYIRNVFTREQIVACDANPSIKPGRETICCRKNCSFMN